MLESIVPVILTLNEEANLRRVLTKLDWAKSILVIDSYSDDNTEYIAKSFSNVIFYKRKFDSAANQWNFGIQLAAEHGNWILALDADYLLSDELVAEMSELVPDEDLTGFEARFVYCIDGTPLNSSLYPEHTVLYRSGYGRYFQDGHTQRLLVQGRQGVLRHPIFHDDRKSPERWYREQLRYARMEAEKIRATSWGQLSFSGKIRRVPLLSIALPCIYLLFYKGIWRNGRHGLKYVWQRSVAEWLIQKALWFRKPREV